MASPELRLVPATQLDAEGRERWQHEDPWEFLDRVVSGLRFPGAITEAHGRLLAVSSGDAVPWLGETEQMSVYTECTGDTTAVGASFGGASGRYRYYGFGEQRGEGSRLLAVRPGASMQDSISRHCDLGPVCPASEVFMPEGILDGDLRYQVAMDGRVMVGYWSYPQGPAALDDCGVAVRVVVQDPTADAAAPRTFGLERGRTEGSWASYPCRAGEPLKVSRTCLVEQDGAVQLVTRGKVVEMRADTLAFAAASEVVVRAAPLEGPASGHAPAKACARGLIFI
jgi:hypothetical protein